VIETSNLVGRLIVANPRPRMTNHCWKGRGVVRSREPFKFWWNQPYLWNGHSQWSNFVHS